MVVTICDIKECSKQIENKKECHIQIYNRLYTLCDSCRVTFIDFLDKYLQKPASPLLVDESNNPAIWYGKGNDDFFTLLLKSGNSNQQLLGGPLNWPPPPLGSPLSLPTITWSGTYSMETVPTSSISYANTDIPESDSPEDDD